MRKAELFSLIENNRPKEVVCSIDKLIKDQGHLPPYHCNLNAIEYAWATVKIFVRNTTGDLSLANLTALLYDAVNRVTADEWCSHCQHVENLENIYWEKDGLMADSIIISTADNSDSEGAESCDEETDSCDEEW
nr:uncharacterized protein LOC122271028 [Parasteatoda tepidariorum]